MNIYDSIHKYREKFKFLGIIYKNYFRTDTNLLASSITYVSLLAIFPFIALILGISKVFLLDEILKDKLALLIPQEERFLQLIFDISQKLIASIKGGLLTGIGMIILLWSMTQVLMLLEDSFNKIWHIKKKRNLTTRLINYIGVIIVLSILTVFIIVSNDSILHLITNKILHLPFLQLSLVSNIINTILFLVFLIIVYVALPNTKVKIKSATFASIITMIGFKILQLAYFYLQSSISKYNAIYGSLAFFPIFLIWVRMVWINILIGAQIAYSIQNEYYNADVNIREMPGILKKEVGLYILSIIIRRFKTLQPPYTLKDLTRITGINEKVIKDTLNEIEYAGYIYQITDNEENIYQLNIDPEQLNINQYINKMNYIEIDEYDNILENMTDEQIKEYNKIIDNIRIDNDELIKNI